VDSLPLPELEEGLNTKIEVVEASRSFGTVKPLIPAIPYGFLTDSQGVDWFFHRTFMRAPSLWPKLRAGQRVSFVIGRNKLGSLYPKCRFWAMQAALSRRDTSGISGVQARDLNRRPDVSENARTLNRKNS
jgi:cold shock CspA family protein